jgi:hypothetical protein
MYAVTVYDVGVPPVPAVMVAVTLPEPATTDTAGVPGFDRAATGVNESDTAGTGVVEALALALALALAVDADAEAVSEGVADVDALADAVESPRTPRTTGAPASAASDPPHPARSMTVHAMTAPAAFPLRLLEPNPLNRLLCALIVGRASPGLSPLIVLVSDTLWGGRLRHYRVNTVPFHKVSSGLKGTCLGFCRGGAFPTVDRVLSGAGRGALSWTRVRLLSVAVRAAN